VLKVDSWSAGKHERTNVEEVLGSSIDTDKHLALDGKRDYASYCFKPDSHASVGPRDANDFCPWAKALLVFYYMVQAMFAGSSMMGESFEGQCRILTSSMLKASCGWIHSSS
jgi:hypothetical protein